MMPIEEKPSAPTCCIPGSASSDGLVENAELASKSKPDGKPQFCTIELPGGWFTMGASDGPYPQDGEGPEREVFVDPFSISSTAVTNREFAKFVAKTGYRSVAEECGYSFVSHLLVPSSVANPQKVLQTPWWCRVDGACWHRPEGGESSIDDRLDHPVVHISLRDALAFCDWAGCRLPTEAEWEYAARGGLNKKPFPWGELQEPNGAPVANIWRGRFPDKSDKPQSAIGTQPVTSYEANGFGLFNMTGNVWEWTTDRFTNLHSPKPSRNPKGPLNGNQFVAKGGSYLCHPSYCMRYRTSSRQALEPNTLAGNIGFRIARN